MFKKFKMQEFNYSHNFFLNLKKYKIYHIITLLTISYLLMLANSFYNIQKDINNLAEKNRIVISKDIGYSISSWLEERVNNIETSSNFFSYNEAFKDEEHLQSLLDILLNDHKYFDTVQALIENYYIFGINGKGHDYREEKVFTNSTIGIDPVYTEWYTSTKKYLKTTISPMKRHGLLLKPTINICSPILLKDIFVGVLCGVIKSESIFDKIKKLKLANDTYFFISDKNGKILTNLKDTSLSELIEKKFIEGKIKKIDKKQEIKIKDNYITIEKFKHFEWYIGVGMKQVDINKLGYSRIFENIAFLSFCFILLLIVINASHEFLRRRVLKTEKEYEYILAHRSRMHEMGELLSGINHQLQQPLNSLTLLLSTTIAKLKDNTLEKNQLNENLDMSIKSIDMMNSTISSFRDFYKCNENITTFFLNDSIQDLLKILHVEFTKKNIKIEFNETKIKDLKINSIQNFIQQILLVLLQNSKDAVSQEQIKKRIIKIENEIQNERILIKIIDWGEGISIEEMKKLFINKKGKSKKDLGSGIGLYFAKKLCQEKLDGDIYLEKSFHPTIFCFAFKKDLNKKD